MALSSVYFDSQGRPALRRSFCAYLDVLGLTDEMATSRPWVGFDGPEPPQDLTGFHRILTEAVAGLKDTFRAANEYPDWEVKAFSDNVAIGYPVPAGDGWHEFGWLMDLVAEFQCRLSTEGYFVRGGIDFGYLFMDDVTVYGPALVDAYKLERDRAQEPRIILSERLRRLVDAHLDTFVPRHLAPHNGSLLVDNDGEVFVNYLSDLVGPPIVADDKVDWHSITAHKDRIEAALGKFAQQPRKWSKYLWVATYHDYFVRLHRGYPGFNEAYLIAPALTPRAPRRLVPWPDVSDTPG
jgi:hypothetical protein